jgi:hypothetical protein
MFPLTRTMRQALATFALVAFTVIPTMYVAYTAWRLNRPGHIRDVEIELSRQIGLQVTIDALRYPRPGEVVYRGLVLRQAEPRGKGLTEIARAREARIVRSGRELTIHADELQLRGESPALALTQLGSILQRSAAIPFERVNLTSSECTVELGTESLNFRVHDLAGEFVADRTNPVVRLGYRMSEENSASTRCELSLARHRSAESVESELMMRTVEGLPLSARVLDAFFDSSSWLGDQARLDGKVTLRQRDGKDWDAEFQGRLLDVDLETMIGRRFPHHRMVGLATLAVKSARWTELPTQQGRGWAEAEGELTAGQGSIGVDLLRAMSRELKFRISPKFSRIDPKHNVIDFRKLGLAFTIRPDGEIALNGALGSEFSPDTVLASLSSPIIFAPQGTAGVPGLIKTLFPVDPNRSNVLVPLTSQSKVLLYLPVPHGLGTNPAPTLEAN